MLFRIQNSDTDYIFRHKKLLKEMSVPFIPGVEKGASLEGNIELSECDVVDYDFIENQEKRVKDINLEEILDFGNEAFLLRSVLTAEECQSFVQKGEELGFEDIRGVRDDYRSCKRY